MRRNIPFVLLLAIMALFPIPPASAAWAIVATPDGTRAGILQGPNDVPRGAREDGLRRCKRDFGKTCVVVLEGVYGCGAIASPDRADRRLGFGKASTKKSAEASALAECQSQGATCRVSRSFCGK